MLNEERIFLYISQNSMKDINTNIKKISIRITTKIGLKNNL